MLQAMLPAAVIDASIDLCEDPLAMGHIVLKAALEALARAPSREAPAVALAAHPLADVGGIRVLPVRAAIGRVGRKAALAVAMLQAMLPAAVIDASIDLCEDPLAMGHIVLKAALEALARAPSREAPAVALAAHPLADVGGIRVLLSVEANILGAVVGAPAVTRGP